jgi:hypothetical protein
MHQERGLSLTYHLSNGNFVVIVENSTLIQQDFMLQLCNYRFTDFLTGAVWKFCGLAAERRSYAEGGGDSNAKL